MQLKTFILCTLAGCLAGQSIIFRVQYENLRHFSKIPAEIVSEPFSVSYSFAKVSSRFFSSIFQYSALILIIKNIRKFSNFFSKDSTFVLACFAIYFYYGKTIPEFYDTFITEQRANFNQQTPLAFFVEKTFLFVCKSIVIELIVLITEHFRPYATSDITDEYSEGMEMGEVDYATENEIIRSNRRAKPTNPWLIVLICLVIYTFVNTLHYDYDIDPLQASQLNATDKFTNGINIRIAPDSKHTLHSRIFIRGFFKRQSVISDNILKTMSDDDISLLTIVLRGQYFSNIHIVELLKNLLYALLYSLVVRTVFIIGCSSFGPNVPESIGRLLVISYAVFVPIVFLMSPFEVLLKKEMIIKGDCYATNHARNIQKAITNMYKWNGAAVVDTQAYKMFFAKEPSLGERLLAIERCYAAKK